MAQITIPDCDNPVTLNIRRICWHRRAMGPFADQWGAYWLCSVGHRIPDKAGLAKRTYHPKPVVTEGPLSQ